MRSWVLAVAVVLWTGAAHAQFANKSIGFSVGYLDLNDADALENAIPIGMMGSIYIENGFDVVAHFGIMLVKDQINRLWVVGVAPSIGIRYLFLEESIRPYIGVDLSYLGVFRSIGFTNYVGVGPNAGIDFFTSDSISLGARVFSNVYLRLNAPLQLSFGGQFIVATYF